MNSKIGYKAITKRKIRRLGCDDVPVGAVVRVNNIIPSAFGKVAIACFWWGNKRYHCPIDLLEEI